MRLLSLAILAALAAAQINVINSGGGGMSIGGRSLIFMALAVKNDDDSISAITAAVQGGEDIDELSPKGVTPLFRAVLQKRTAIVEALLALGADPLTTNPAGFSTLDAAMLAGHAAAVPLLVAAGVDPFRVGQDRNPPLARAMWNAGSYEDDHAAAVEAFLEAVPSLEVADTFVMYEAPEGERWRWMPKPIFLACENSMAKAILSRRLGEQLRPPSSAPDSIYAVDGYDYDFATKTSVIQFAVTSYDGSPREPFTVNLATPGGAAAPPGPDSEATAPPKLHSEL